MNSELPDYKTRKQIWITKKAYEHLLGLVNDVEQQGKAASATSVASDVILNVQRPIPQEAQS